MIKAQVTLTEEQLKTMIINDIRSRTGLPIDGVLLISHDNEQGIEAVITLTLPEKIGEK